MPSQRRHRQPQTSPPPSPTPRTEERRAAERSTQNGRRGGTPIASDVDLARFNAALKASETRQRDAAAEAERRRTQARVRADAAVAHERALAAARVELERAVAAVRTASRSGTGKAEADLAWRRAKAEVIRLETGKAPAWATDDRPDDQVPPSSSADEADIGDGD